MDNATASDAWLDAYERVIDDPDYLVDYEAEALPTHPNVAKRGLIVITRSAGPLPLGMPRPSWTLASGTRAQSGWWLAWPVFDSPDSKRSWNLYAQVSQCLAYYVKGKAPEMVVNMAHLPAEVGSLEGQFLEEMRSQLTAAQLWTKASTLPSGFASMGGSTRSAAQTEARRAWAARGRAARSAQAAQRAAEVVEVPDRGLSLEAVAAMFGTKPSSVRRTVARARSRLGTTP